jgi:hypothetical protein
MESKVLYCIDPGTTSSGYVKLRISPSDFIVEEAKSDYLNEELISASFPSENAWAMIEGIANTYGRSVGRDVMETAWWSGRFYQRFAAIGIPTGMPSRHSVLRGLFGRVPKRSDVLVRELLIERFGGKELAIGKKSSKGPLYEVKGHAWQALGLGYQTARDVLRLTSPRLR